MSVPLRIQDRPRAERGTRFRPVAEGLEARLLMYATLGCQWTYGSRITYSFVPDGTNVGGIPSAWFQAMNSRGFSTATWQLQFQKAAAIWETVAGVNLVQVPDNGSAVSCSGNQQSDSRFGDVRIAGISQSSSVLGLTFLPPPVNGGTMAGDIVMNTNQTWQINSDYDIETVAIHEFGHALGLDHSAITSAVMYAYYSTVKQSLTSDDSAGLQAIYGARAMDGYEPNNVNTQAANISSAINADLQIKLAGLDISSSTDNDWFKVVVPTGAAGTMTVSMQSAGLSSLAPRSHSTTPRSGSS